MSVVLVTGTDTDVGKTLITGALAGVLKKLGYKTGVYKPVQSGVRLGDPSSDSARLKHLSGMDVPENEICPVTLKHPLAPMMAARMEGVTLDPAQWEQTVEEKAREYDFLFVEGAGGLTVPLAEGYSVSTMAERLRLPLLIVSRAGLGMVNHTMLTIEYAQSRKIPVIGIVINGIGWRGDDFAEQTNPDLLRELTDVPILGKVPWIRKTDQRAAILNSVRNNVKIPELIELIDRKYTFQLEEC